MLTCRSGDVQTVSVLVPLRAPPSPPICPVLHEISTILDTGLDRRTLSLLLELTESGVNPEALAAVVKELRREAATLSAQR